MSSLGPFLISHFPARRFHPRRQNYHSLAVRLTLGHIFCLLPPLLILDCFHSPSIFFVEFCFSWPATLRSEFSSLQASWDFPDWGSCNFHSLFPSSHHFLRKSWSHSTFYSQIYQSSARESQMKKAMLKDEKPVIEIGREQILRTKVFTAEKVHFKILPQCKHLISEFWFFFFQASRTIGASKIS